MMDFLFGCVDVHIFTLFFVRVEQFLWWYFLFIEFFFGFKAKYQY